MNTFMRNFAKMIAGIFSLFFNSKMLKFFYILKCYFFWDIKKRNFKSVGKNSFVGLRAVIKDPESIIIGNNFYAEDDFRMETWPEYFSNNYNPEILIKDNVSFGYRCHIGCINKIIIKENCLFGSNVYITDHFHGEINSDEFETIPKERKLYSKGPVSIGKSVWIGDNVVIMPDVTIGDNSIIGANSVVTHDIPENSVAAGIPARIIKQN